MQSRDSPIAVFGATHKLFGPFIPTANATQTVLYGNDSGLLKIRAEVLRHLGFSVMTVDMLTELKSVPPTTAVALVVLCHSLAIGGKKRGLPIHTVYLGGRGNHRARKAT